MSALVQIHFAQVKSQITRLQSPNEVTNNYYIIV
jgi:hypothetical protein